MTRKRKAMLFELGCGSIAFFCEKPSLQNPQKIPHLARVIRELRPLGYIQAS